MIKFRCQLNWAIGCPDIWLKIILDVSAIVFMDDDNL